MTKLTILVVNSFAILALAYYAFGAIVESQQVIPVAAPLPPNAAVSSSIEITKDIDKTAFFLGPIMGPLYNAAKTCVDVLDPQLSVVDTINCALFCGSCGRSAVCADTRNNLVETMCTCNCNPRTQRFLGCQAMHTALYCPIQKGTPENSNALANCQNVCTGANFTTGVLCGFNLPPVETCTCLC